MRNRYGKIRMILLLGFFLSLAAFSALAEAVVYDIDNPGEDGSSKELSSEVERIYPGETIRGYMTLYFGRNLEDADVANLGLNEIGQSVWTNTTGTVYTISEVTGEEGQKAYLLSNAGYGIEVAGGTSSTDDVEQTDNAYTADDVTVSYDNGESKVLTPDSRYYKKNTEITVTAGEPEAGQAFSQPVPSSAQVSRSTTRLGRITAKPYLFFKLEADVHRDVLKVEIKQVSVKISSPMGILVLEVQGELEVAGSLGFKDQGGELPYCGLHLGVIDGVTSIRMALK